MNGRHQSPLFDTDSLQADVMRFMAIIAFCLIAILALVQKLETDSPVSPAPEFVTESVPEPAGLVPAESDTKSPMPLTLRFVSDGVFLKLIRQESIRLYGRTGDEYRQLKSDFSLETVPVKGNLYEVMPASLPQTVRSIFTRHQETDLYLVSLPGTTAAEVARLTSLHTDVGGEMLIDEQGLVRYEQDNH